MRKRLKKTLIILGSTVLSILLILVIAFTLFLHQKSWVKGYLEKQLFKRTGIQVKIGTLDYELFPLRIEAGEITLTTRLDDTEVDVFVQKLNLAGDLHKIRKKAKPYFDTIAGEGIRVEARIKKARKKIAPEDILNLLSSLMDLVRRISMKDAYLAFLFPGQEITLQGVDLSLAPAEGPDSYAYSLFCREAGGRSEAMKSGFRNAVRGSGTLTLRKKAAVDGLFSLRDNMFSVSEKSVEFEKIDLRFNGTLDTNTNTFTLPDFELDLPLLICLSCPLTVNYRDDITLRCRPRILFADLNKLHATAKNIFPFQLEGFEIDGSMSYEGRAEFSPSRAGSKIRITGKIGLNPTRIAYRTSLFDLDCRLAGNITIDDFPGNQNFAGRLNMTQGFYASKFLEARGINAGLDMVYDGKRSRLSLSGMKAGIRGLAVEIPNNKLEFRDIGFLGQARVDPKKGIFYLSRSTVRLPPFPPLFIEAGAGLNRDASKFISLKSSAIGIQPLLGYFSAFIPKSLTDWEPEGKWDLQIDARHIVQENDDAWEVSARLEGSGVRFHDPSFSLASESLEPSLVLEGTFRRSLREVPLSINFNLAQGESLWKDFYIDWGRMPIRGHIKGIFHTSPKTITGLSQEAILPGFGRISSRGFIDLQASPSVDLAVSATELDLSSLYSFITQKGAGDRLPTGLRGKAETRFTAKGDWDAFAIKGHVAIKDASVSAGDSTFSVKEMSGYLPFHLEKNDASKGGEDSPEEEGYITIRDTRVSSLAIDSLDVRLSSRRNGYTIDPFELEIFTATASVGKTELEFGPDFGGIKGQSSFTWKDVDLSLLPFRTEQFNPRGTLSVEVPLLEIRPDRIDAEGQGKMRAYGGNIAITDIRMERPFSKDRTISCHVNFAGLDLEEITDTIPFGRVTGIVSGEIQDLAFSYGQPERFVFRLESEKRKGIPQRFSLKATNDLAILGTGEKTPFSPQSGWTRVVKDFRYNKIGILCSLKNDMFSLRGTIRKKGTEYLVKGSGLFAINVVNKQARNQIRFKDMLSRLKRIGQTKQSP